MAHYEAHYIVIKKTRHGWSAHLTDASGRVLNAINGDPHDSRAKILTAARRHWPDALYARQSRDASLRRTQKVWELWSRVDGEDGFVNAYKDKGEAQRFAKRLKRSHPYAHYFVKRRAVASRKVWGGRAMRRWKHPADRDASRHRFPSHLSPKTRARVARKIRLLRREGYPEKQAVAIAYRMSGVKAKSRRKERRRAH